MRIALISKWLGRESERFGPEGGFVQQLAEALIERGHEVIALSQAKGAHRGERKMIGRIPVQLFDAEKRRPALALLDKVGKSLTGHRKILTDALEIRHFLKEQGPFDLVWAQAEDPDGTACGVAARLGELPPLLIMVQAVRWAEGKSGELLFTQQRNLNIGFVQAKRVLANSPLSAQWLEEQYGVALTRLGFYRVNLTRSFLAAAEKARATPVAPESLPRILFLGALNATKAPDVFLEAARQLAAHHMDWHFVVAGGKTENDRTLEAKLNALRNAPELRGRLTFTGALAEAEVIAEISRATLVVCPSRIDTLSRATVEALVLGKPVVVTENVGARALVEMTGAGLVTRCEPASLAAGIEQTLSRPQFAAQARANAESLAQDHSPESAAKQMEESFRQAMG